MYYLKGLSKASLVAYMVILQSSLVGGTFFDDVIEGGSSLDGEDQQRELKRASSCIGDPAEEECVWPLGNITGTFICREEFDRDTGLSVGFYSFCHHPRKKLKEGDTCGCCVDETGTALACPDVCPCKCSVAEVSDDEPADPDRLLRGRGNGRGNGNGGGRGSGRGSGRGNGGNGNNGNNKGKRKRKRKNKGKNKNKGKKNGHGVELEDAAGEVMCASPYAAYVMLMEGTATCSESCEEEEEEEGGEGPAEPEPAGDPTR